MNLNLGCGLKKLDGFVNIDYDSSLNPDIVCDLRLGIPFPDNSVSIIYSSHFLEHVPDLESLLYEMYRVSKNGALWDIIVPIPSMQNTTNIQHYRTFLWTSFDTYCFPKGYMGIKLKRINKNPNIFYRISLYILPFLFKEVNIKLKVLKDDKNEKTHY